MSKPAKLPVWTTLRDCYLLPLENWRVVLDLSWTWLLLQTPITLAFAAMAYNNDDKSPSAIMGFIQMCIEWLPMASIAVGWHQFLLLNRPPLATPYLRMDRTVWTYYAWGLAIAFVTIAIIAVPFLLWVLMNVADTVSDEAKVQPAVEALSTPVQLLATLVFSFVAALTFRVALTLPSTAVEGDRPLNLRSSFTLTRGNTLRLCIIGTLGTLPCLLLAILLGGNEHSLFAYLASQLLIMLLGAIFAITGVTLFSLAYRHFMRQPLDSQGNLP